MASSYINIVTFLLTTLFYYLALKPPLSYSQLTNLDEYKKYTNNNFIYLGVYFLLILVIQFMVNAYIITTKCGGSITENIGAACAFTFFPWTLLFGVVIVILIVYPGFKSAFSDVIGYFYVSKHANNILNELLINKDIQGKIDADNISTKEQKIKMQDAAEAIIKICGNTSILINQIVPNNFVEYWNILKPLMKPEYQNVSDSKTIEKMNELFELVVTRDNVGEAMWFIYVGLLVTSIVQLNLSVRGCITNPKQMVKNYQEFLNKEEKVKKNKEISTSQVYTMSS
jgi:hypothetical protein